MKTPKNGCATPDAVRECTSGARRIRPIVLGGAGIHGLEILMAGAV